MPHYAGPFWIFGAVILTTFIAWRSSSPAGAARSARLREDEIAAAAVGVDPTRYKVTSFVIAACGAGIAGGLLAHRCATATPIVQPDQFNFPFSFDAITMVILGGSGSVTGAVLGGVFVTFTVKFIELIQGVEAVRRSSARNPGSI